MKDDPLQRLEALLRRRKVLRDRSTGYWGASERSPSFGPADQAAWNQVLDETREVEQAISELAQWLRSHAPERFADWVAARRRLHEQRLAAPDVSKWEVIHLRDIIANWDRFLHEDYRDFYRWGDW